MPKAKTIKSFYRAVKPYRAPSARAIANAVGSVLTTGANLGGQRTSTRTQTKRTYSTAGLQHRGRKRMKTTKRKAINSAPKSKRVRKFNAKVMDALKSTKSYGEYIYQSCLQLRQDIRDRYGVRYTDFNGRLVTVGDLRACADAYSVCFNSKAMGNDFRVLTNNVDKNTTFSTAFENLSMFFKSTSTHVVNIEIYECIAKMNMLDAMNPQAMVAQSFNDYVNRWAATNPSAEGSFGPDALGCQSRHMTSLFQYFTVKVHKVKLLPGASSSLTFKRKGKVWDQSKHLDTLDNITAISKGASYFFFRTLNDPTVSGNPDVGVEPSCQHWPSNTQGGVACRYTRTIRVVPNNLAPSTVVQQERPAVVIANWINSVATQTDQQVVYQAPFKLAEVAQ